MPYITLSELSETTTTTKKKTKLRNFDFDFIIVGGGSSGCPLASRLSEDLSITVLLVEAGYKDEDIKDDNELRFNHTCPAGVGKLQFTSLDWCTYWSEPQGGNKGACTHYNTHQNAKRPNKRGQNYVPRGKGIGGTSKINYMAYVRGHRNDYDKKWTGMTAAAAGSCMNNGYWSSDIVEKIFNERIEDTTECQSTRICSKCRRRQGGGGGGGSGSAGSDSRSDGGGGIGSGGGPLGISHKIPINPLSTAFIQTTIALGYERGDYNCFCCSCPSTNSDDMDDNNFVGGVVDIHQQTVRQGTRCDVARAYIDPLLNNTTSTKDHQRRPNLFVVTQARCRKVLVEKKIDDDGKLKLIACGVELYPEGNESNSPSPSIIKVMCTKEVILSAGVLGSPQILLQSGIGPQGDTLQLKHVGQNLQDHIVSFLTYSPKLGQQGGSRNQDIGCINKSKIDGTPFRLFNAMYQMFLKGQGPLTSSTYDASLFFSSSSSSSNNMTNMMEKLPYPDLQLSMLCSPCDPDILENNLGLDFDTFEIDRSKEMAPNSEGLSLCCCLLHPKSRGYVELRNNKNSNSNISSSSASSDNNDNNKCDLVIHANYFSDEGNEDIQRLIVALRTGFKVANTAPLNNLIAGVPWLPKDLLKKYNLSTIAPPADEREYPDAFFEEYLRRYASTQYHFTSTCKMAKTPNEGVVNEQLEVFGIDGLRVADASIQPEIVSGNTNASCILIGERAADFIREKYNLTSNPIDLNQAVKEYESGIRRNRIIKFAIFVAVLTAGFVAFIMGMAKVVAMVVKANNLSPTTV